MHLFVVWFLMCRRSGDAYAWWFKQGGVRGVWFLTDKQYKIAHGGQHRADAQCRPNLTIGTVTPSFQRGTNRWLSYPSGVSSQCELARSVQSMVCLIDELPMLEIAVYPASPSMFLALELCWAEKMCRWWTGVMANHCHRCSKITTRFQFLSVLITPESAAQH